MENYYTPGYAPDNNATLGEELEAEIRESHRKRYMAQDEARRREKNDAADAEEAMQPDPAMIVVLEYLGGVPLDLLLRVGGGGVTVKFRPEPNGDLGPWQNYVEYRDAIGFVTGAPDRWRLVAKLPEKVIDNRPPDPVPTPRAARQEVQPDIEGIPRADLERELEQLAKRIMRKDGSDFRPGIPRADRDRYHEIVQLLSGDATVDLTAIVEEGTPPPDKEAIAEEAEAETEGATKIEDLLYIDSFGEEHTL